MASSSLLLLTSVISFISHFHGVDSKGGTTDAICLPGSQYAWTGNAQNQSPCLLAANAIAPCKGSGGWNVPALTDGVHYDPPTPSQANRCYCSWAVYNLLGACAACQGLADSIQNWIYYRQNCLAMNESLYPPGLLSEFCIPHYAIRNPLNWTAENI
ncbi:hypothetical protein K435DRAFT_208246 [Dendrothele bispora CBS 962.96]|uniref:Uncharacterized protein n=1 Tax=Dendrothele bispora (strain CBS 962.96) TaxID=1314807 RepID=A0A4S8LU26_DENBC|nr:hypothetical protein K435DRAFT_208246 [Dendrothele bispora CBS 962.96]